MRDTARRATFTGYLVAGAALLWLAPVRGGDTTSSIARADDMSSSAATSCIDNSFCPATHYCEKPVGACDSFGVCAPRPEVCTFDFSPVCGCDDVTYSNACHAAGSGVSVAFLGSCTPPKPSPTPTPTPTSEPVQPIDIDVSPFGEGKRLQVGSRQRVLVAILGAADFDVLEVDVDNLAFGPAGAAPLPSPAGRAFPVPSALDVDRDGELDLVVRFDISQTGLQKNDKEGCLTGQTLAGRAFEGCDAISTAKP